MLNAKQHEREAADHRQDAGQKGAVTIATNMAGRGVDIKLGEGVPEAGGLYVLGTERHESRRIDNQLRGRSGRQGDPGETRFYLSAEDDVVRLFAGDRIYKILDRLKVPEGEPIEHSMLTNRIEGAQRRVEEHNFEIRKNVLKYDDVLNIQRGVVYEQRHRVLNGEDISDLIREWMDETVWSIVEAHTDESFSEEWDLEGMMVGLRGVYPVSFTLEDLGDRESISKEDLLDRVAADAQAQYEAKEAIFSRIDPPTPTCCGRPSASTCCSRSTSTGASTSTTWTTCEKGIGLRGLAQKDPLVEYRTEGHAMFSRHDGARAGGGRDEPLPPRSSRWPTRRTAARRSSTCSTRRSCTRSRALIAQHEEASALAGPRSAGEYVGRTAHDERAARVHARAGRAAPRRAGGRAQRSVLVRQRQEVQALSRRLSASAARHSRPSTSCSVVRSALRVRRTPGSSDVAR